MSILQAGQILTAQNGQRWRIEKLLGSGMTAEVYQAVSADEQAPPVAMKYLRPGVVDDVRNLFFAEAENLQRVYQAWDSARGAEGTLGQLTRFFPFPAPRLQGVSEEPPFILMDLVQGIPLETFLQDQQEEEDKEKVVVGLGVHLGTLLWVLHEKAHRCYSDMKIENFWWVGEESQPALLLTDWNVLNEVEKEWVQRDLFLATLMLYTWLTGDVLPRQRLQVTVPLGTVPAFQSLSQGVRQFLRRALSPTLEMRYATAQEWTLALLEIWQWWRMKEEQLETELTKRFNEIQGLDAKIREQETQGAPPRELILAQAETYRVFGSMLDIATWHGLEVPEEYEEAFLHYSEQLSPQGIGLRALQGLSYDLALEQFERGASLFPAEMVAYRHWWTLADGARRMSMEHFRAIRERAIEGVKRANTQQWQEAKVLLDEAAAAAADMDIEGWRHFLEEVAQGSRSLKEGLRENGVVLLDIEAWAAVWYREAEVALQRGDYERAQDLARKAQALVDLLPVDENHAWYVQHSEIAAIEDTAARRMQAATKESEIWRTWHEARQQKRWDEVVDALRNAWDWLPEEQHPKVVARWEETARQMWEEGAVDALRQLVNRWAALIHGKTEEGHLLWQNLSSVVFSLYTLKQKRQEGSKVTETLSTWQVLLEKARALDWGLGPISSEVLAWKRAFLESGKWAQWNALMALWAKVDWDSWQEYLRTQEAQMERYLTVYIESTVKRLEGMAAVLMPEMATPTLAVEIQGEVADLQRRLEEAARSLKVDTYETRLRKVQERVEKWLSVYRREEGRNARRREKAWARLDALLGWGAAVPAEQFWATVVDQIGFLLALGEQTIPDERANVLAYYRAFVENQQPSQGIPLERLRQHLFGLWVESTDINGWFAHLKFLRSQGKWDEVYWWAERLARHLPAEVQSSTEQVRQRLEEWRTEALDVLEFTARFTTPSAPETQTMVTK